MLEAQRGPWSAARTRNGVSADHREGDGTTPEGAFAIGPVIYGVAPDPGVRYRYHRLVCGDWWDEDPASPTLQPLRAPPLRRAAAVRRRSEALWRSNRAYAYFALIDYNVDPAVAGAGSAIFIHRHAGRPTNGCVALPAAELVRLLRWLRPGRAADRDRDGRGDPGF